MSKPPLKKPLTLNGRTGEGGGQIIRVAVALAALTGTPLQINNVRGNRAGSRGGGLKAQHVSCIQTLATATNAATTGVSIGSKSFTFHAHLSPLDIVNRNIKVRADSAASVLLVFQAVLPFFLFAGDEKGSPVEITIQGGTNVSFSLSYEYLDQVLLQSLERFGIEVERKLEFRGWSHGMREIGSVKLGIKTLKPGKKLRVPEWPQTQGTVTKIDVTIIVPREVQEVLKKCLLFEIDLVFPGVEVNFVVVDDSRHKSRLYTLLVAHTTTNLLFGRDWFYDRKSKYKTADQLATEISQKVIDDLDTEIRKGGLVDEYLQDQLVVFQALAEGRSSIAGTKEGLESEGKRERVERADEPCGEGSLHTTTARWVASQLLEGVKWIDGGRVCEGVGWSTSEAKRESKMENTNE